MKKEVHRKRYSVSTIVMLLTAGIIFVAIGIAVPVSIMIASAPKDFANGYILIPIIFFGLIPIAVGTVPLVMGVKQIYGWVRLNKAKKSSIETTATITDYKIVSHSKGGNLNKRYALTLSYTLNDNNKTFTTDYLFDINEFRYLKKLDKIRIKIDGSFVAVTEPFTEDIYKLDARYEIETAFFKQKPVAKTLKIWRILCVIAIAFLIVAIVLTTILEQGIYVLIGVILLFSVNLPVAIVIAVYLIKWIRRKR